MSRPRTRRQVEAEVESLAQEAMEVADITHAEARAFVWEEFPELYSEYQTAAPEQPREPVAKSRTVTLADAIADAVHREADRQAWTRWPDRTIEQIRGEVWLSPEGEKLYALSKARGQEEYYAARLAKSAGERDAWSILEQWRR